ncbi:MAG: hypothetical protein U0176_10365 [Bacteroidia bacterium]
MEGNKGSGRFLYYVAHQDELVRLYNGKVIVMKDEVVGVFENEHDAYWDSVRRFEPGTFMIQLCTPGREAYTIKGHQKNYNRSVVIVD